MTPGGGSSAAGGDGGPPGRGPDDADLEGLVRDARATAYRVSGAVAGTTFVLLHAIVGWLTLSLGLVAPWWAVVPLGVVWLVVAVVAWPRRARHPIAVMLAPLATAVLVLATVAFGSGVLGWNA